MKTPVMRKELLRVPVGPNKLISNIEAQEITMGPGVKAPLHLHPCPTIGVVTKGRITFQVEGKRERYLKKGEAFYEPAGGKMAKFNNEGTTSAKFVVFYLFGKNKKETIRILNK